MNMNILVLSQERTGNFRAQKPVTCALAHKPFTHHVQPLLLPSSAGEGPSQHPWKNLLVPSIFLTPTSALHP